MHLLCQALHKPLRVVKEALLPDLTAFARLAVEQELVVQVGVVGRLAVVGLQLLERDRDEARLEGLVVVVDRAVGRVAAAGVRAADLAGGTCTTR